VRLSASQPVACYLLPPVLARMREALPAIQIELVVSNQVSNLLQREADIALRMVQPAQASLVAKRIAEVTCRPAPARLTWRGAAHRRSPPTCCSTS
jgi:DNA-binding transcriptional LysR family regulator